MQHTNIHENWRLLAWFKRPTHCILSNVTLSGSITDSFSRQQDDSRNLQENSCVVYCQQMLTWSTPCQVCVQSVCSQPTQRLTEIAWNAEATMPVSTVQEINELQRRHWNETETTPPRCRYSISVWRKSQLKCRILKILLLKFFEDYEFWLTDV